MVAVGNNGITYSYDGIVWSSPNGTPIGGIGHGVAWNGALWVAVGGNGISSSSIATSPDGINWTDVSSGLSAGNGVAWNGSLWVAVGQGSSSIVTSPDGINWTNASSSVSIVNGIAWNGSLWVAVGSGTPDILYSYDGFNWTGAGAQLGGFGSGIAWNGALWVAVGGDGESPPLVVTSPDGINWTGRTTPLDGLEIGSGIAWNGSLWVAACTVYTINGGILYSPDGITWTLSASGSALMPSAYGIAWNGSLWVAVGATAGIIYSVDGINWSSAPSSPFNDSYNGRGIASRRPLPYVGETIVPPLLHQAPLTGPTGGALVFESPTGTNNLYYSRFLNILENSGTGTLSIQGNLDVSGTISKTAGSFLIPHPDPAKTETHLLRHCFVEAPTRGDNLYRWTLTTTDRSADQALPSYSPFLNESWQFFVNPVSSWGQGYVELSADETSFRLLASEDGVYDVLGIATRKDAAAKDFFDGQGPEFLRG